MATWSWEEGCLRCGRPLTGVPGREAAVESVPVRPASPLLCAGRGGFCQTRPEEEGGGGYRLALDVAGFGPEELSVRLQGRRLTVRGKRQHRTEIADGCVSHEYREVRKEVLLPDDADWEALSCALHDGGRLCLRAPRLAPRPRTSPVDGGAPSPPPNAPGKAAPTPEVDIDDKEEEEAEDTFEDSSSA